MTDLVLGIDLGTSYLKLGLFDRQGSLRGLGRVSICPQTGDGTLCEVPLAEFLAAFRGALAEALANAAATPADIRGLSYASQANSFLLLDASGAPLTPVILWPDARAKTVDAALLRLWQRDDFLQATGFGVGAMIELVAAKILWFQQHRPGLWKSVRHVMMVSDYLVYCLTGQAQGDAGTASMLGLLDQRTLDWWPPAMDALQLDAKVLSRPLRPGTPAGTTAASALSLGMPVGLPVAIGGMDHHLAAIGAGLGTLGQISESTGTVLACVRYTNQYTPLPGCTCGPGLSPGQHYQLNWDENGAGVLAWYRRTFAPQLEYRELIQLAQDLPADAPLPLARPRAHTFSGLEGFDGASNAFGHGHCVKAILNSTAQSLVALVRQFSPQAGERVVATGGGARSDFWLQTYADRLGVEVVATDAEEPACLGAAMLGAVAAGWYNSVPEAGGQWVRRRKVFSPQPPKSQ